MSTTVVKVNGVEISTELAQYIKSRHDEFQWYAEIQSEVIDFLIDRMEGGDPPQEVTDKIVKHLLLSVKGVKDSMKKLAEIIEKLEIDNKRFES